MKNEKAYFFLSSLLTCCFILILSSKVLAESTEEESAEESKPKHMKVNTALQTPEWIDLEFKISTLSVKIQGMQETLNNLILQKKALPEDSEKLKDVVDQIKQIDKDIRVAIEEHSKASAKLKYRHPVRGEHNRKKYERIHQDSVEQLEEALGVDGKLNLVLVRMRKQFGSSSVGQGKNGSALEDSSRSPASLDKSDSQPGEVTIDKAQPVILSK